MSVRRPAVTVVAVAIIALTRAAVLPAASQDTAAFHELATELAGVYALRRTATW